jgi:hypothetical protein
MPRPKSKNELLDLSDQNFKKLNELIDKLPEERKVAEFHPGTMNRNIRDVLAHLHEWHLMMERWYTEGMKGEKPAIPAEGYTWKTTPELNRKIWEKYRGSKLEEIRKKFDVSHKRIHFIIEKHRNNELFEKKRYKWTGTTSLGAYLISATSSHYDWALKLIKKGLK